MSKTIECDLCGEHNPLDLVLDADFKCPHCSVECPMCKLIFEKNKIERHKKRCTKQKVVAAKEVLLAPVVVDPEENKAKDKVTASVGLFGSQEKKVEVEEKKEEEKPEVKEVQELVVEPKVVKEEQFEKILEQKEPSKIPEESNIPEISVQKPQEPVIEIQKQEIQPEIQVTETKAEQKVQEETEIKKEADPPKQLITEQEPKASQELKSEPAAHVPEEQLSSDENNESIVKCYFVNPSIEEEEEKLFESLQSQDVEIIPIENTDQFKQVLEQSQGKLQCDATHDMLYQTKNPLAKWQTDLLKCTYDISNEEGAEEHPPIEVNDDGIVKDGLYHCALCELIICARCAKKIIAETLNSKTFIITCPLYAQAILEETMRFNPSSAKKIKGVIIYTDEDFVKKNKKKYGEQEKFEELFLGVATCDDGKIIKYIKKQLKK